MPTNLPPDYGPAEEEYYNAKTTKERIDALRKMLSIIPKHKGTEKLVAHIRRKISLMKESSSKKKAKKRGLKKEGEARVVLFGTPNSGKSYLLKRLTGKKTNSTPIPFETTKPEVGMIDYSNIKIQLIELPSIYKGYSEKNGEFMSIAYHSELIVMMGDSKLCRKELEFIESKKIYLKDIKNAKETIWNNLNMIKVFTKTGKKVGGAMALKKDSTVQNAAEKVHHDFVKKFKFAKIWRKSRHMKTVGLKYKLKDGDTIEFHTD
ncbi:hypothetical protein DRO91_09330 [Candidatus Heimdallarchaeota archaeon]|nr:MAG: hypothetical protein DRO91_09330 [Candidatus Heimdallarchaeota archaeon]